MKKQILVLILLLSAVGCLQHNGWLRPIALSGDKLRITQSQFHDRGSIDQYYTNSKNLKIEITIEKASDSVKQTVLWFKQKKNDPYQLGPVSKPYENYINFRPAEGRYWCRGSVIYSDGSTEFKPNPDTRPGFCLIVDRSPPMIILDNPGTTPTNTTAEINFKIYDEGLGPLPTADLYYSPDNGNSWKTLAVIHVTAGDNTYKWQVKENPGKNNLIKIRCNDYTGNETVVQTKKCFTILPHPTAKEALKNLFTSDKRQKRKTGEKIPSVQPNPPDDNGKSNMVKQSKPSDPQNTNLVKTASTAPKIPAGSISIPLKQTTPQKPQDNLNQSKIRIIPPKQLKAGSLVAVPIEGITGNNGNVRISWQSSPSNSWIPLNGKVKDGLFLWKAPDKDTTTGKLKLEILDTAEPGATYFSDNIIIDGTPPEISINVAAADDPRNVSVRVKANDIESEVEWIRLYITDNQGISWHTGPKDMKELDKYNFIIPRKENELGFYAQASDKLGNTSAAPIEGTPPKRVIGPKPDISIKLNELSEQILKGGDMILLTWAVKGIYPKDVTAYLSIREGENQTWQKNQVIYSTDLQQDKLLWETPNKTTKDLWIRIELDFPGKTALVSNPIGPYFIDADSPILIPQQKEYWASTAVHIPFQLTDSGPSGLAKVTVYARPQGSKNWLPLPTINSKKICRARCYGLDEGDYDLYLYGCDGSGNETPKPIMLTKPQAKLVVDKTPPIIKFKLNPPIYEGVQSKLTITTISEEAQVTILLKEEGKDTEVSILRQTISHGTPYLTFYSPPGFRNGSIWLRAIDKAGNLTATQDQNINIKDSITFDFQAEKTNLQPGQLFTIKYIIQPGLLEEKPTLTLFSDSGNNGSLDLIDSAITPTGTEGSYPWHISKQPGPGLFFVIEAKCNGILRASAKTKNPLQIMERKSIPIVEKQTSEDKTPTDPWFSDYIKYGNEDLTKAKEALHNNDRQKGISFSTKAKDEFIKANGINPAKPQSWWGLAQLCCKPFTEEDADSLIKAEEYFKKAAELDKNPFQALVHLGVCRIKLGNYAYTKQGSTTGSTDQHGEAYKHYMEAINPLAKALNIKEDPVVHYNLGLAQLRIGKITEAINDFQTAIKGPRPVQKAYELLIECWLRKPDYNRANDVLKEAVANKAISQSLQSKITAFIEKQQGNK